MAPKRGIDGVVRAIAGRMSGHQLFDITARTPTSHLQPLGLVLRGRDARQLTNDGPGDGSIAQRLRDRRKTVERLGHADSLLGPAGPIAEEALDVFGEARVTESQVNGTPLRTHEPRAFFEVELCARFGNARELVMNMLPIEMVIHEVH